MDPIEEDPVQETQAAQEAAQEAAGAESASIDERLIDKYEVLVEEVRRQLQAVQGVGEWIEEYGQLEETYGRALCKVCMQHRLRCVVIVFFVLLRVVV